MYLFFLCGQVPNDQWTGTGPRPRGWGPLFTLYYKIYHKDMDTNCRTLIYVGRKTALMLLTSRGHELSVVPTGQELKTAGRLERFPPEHFILVRCILMQACVVAGDCWFPRAFLSCKQNIDHNKTVFITYSGQPATIDSCNLTGTLTSLIFSG